MKIPGVFCAIIFIQIHLICAKTIGLNKWNDTNELSARYEKLNELDAEENGLHLLHNPANDSLEIEGRKKGGNVIVVPSSDHGHSGGGYWETEVVSGGKRKGQGKKNKMKWKKHGWPIALGMFIMKALLFHFILKKVALLSAASFMLGKLSFILSTLIALKLFFTGHSQERADHKLQVVHIPIHSDQKPYGAHKKSYVDNFYQSAPRKPQSKPLPKYIPINTADYYEVTTTGYYDNYANSNDASTGSGYQHYYSDEQNVYYH